MKRVIGEDMVNNCLMLLTKVGETKTNHPSLKVKGGGGGGGFKCKTCQRQFLSFQALGGHRASHKKLKLMDRNFLSASPAKTKMHLCPVCGVEFAVGQALGGHMRKHRANSMNNDGNFVNNIHDHGARKLNSWLDLNLTPSENDLKLDLRTPVLDCFI